LEQAAQQNSAIQDKGFACEGLAQKTGKQLVVPRSKLVDKRDDSWAKDFFLQFLACGPLPTTKERSSSLYLRYMDKTSNTTSNSPFRYLAMVTRVLVGIPPI
jgi:hypothetical protein